MPQAGARSFFGRAVGGESGGGEAERNRGGREPPPAWPCGVRWPEDASDNEPNLRLARELHRPEKMGSEYTD